MGIASTDRGSFVMRPCACRGVRVVEARSRHTFPRHTHDSYGIGLIVTGAQRVQGFRAAYVALTGRHADAGSAHERLILLLAGLLHPKRPSSALVAPELARAKARIDDDPTAPTTLADLAREAGMSCFQVVRGFTRLTGLTPHAYIVQRRLDAARAMIAAGATLANAAAACGFADQSHFNRTFVGRYGMTPGTYAEAVHGFQLVPEATKALLLRSYWTVSERQIATSVVLAAPVLTSGDARQLVERAGS